MGRDRDSYVAVLEGELLPVGLPALWQPGVGRRLFSQHPARKNDSGHIYDCPGRPWRSKFGIRQPLVVQATSVGHDLVHGWTLLAPGKLQRCDVSDMFWCSLYGLWLVASIDRPWKELLPQAQAFAVLIVSLMFLGGAVGKYTPAYWSGEVLYQIYFVDRPFWFFEG